MVVLCMGGELYCLGLYNGKRIQLTDIILDKKYHKIS